MVALRELLALPALQVGEPSPLDAEATSVEIRWVLVSDHPDVAEVLHGGELVLTHGLGIGAEPEQQRRWIESLIEAGVAAIGLRLEHAFTSLPEIISHACKVASVALFTLHHRLDFGTVLMECHTLILDERSDRVRAALAAGQAASELAMSGRGVQQVLDRLAGDLGGVVVLEDSSRRIVGFSEPVGDAKGAAPWIFRDWDSHSHASHAKDNEYEAVETGGTSCLHADLLVRGMAWGRLHLVSSSGPLDVEFLIAVRQCALAIVASLAQHHQFGGLAAGIQGDLLSDILNLSLSPAQSMRHARAIGIDLSGEMRVLMIEFADADSEQYALDETRRAMAATGLHGLIAGNGRNRVTALLAFGGASTVSSFIGALSVPLGDGSSRPLRSIGVSEQHLLGDIKNALDESKRALAAVDRRDAIPVKYFSELGVERVFADLAVSEQLHNFVDLMIGRVIAHDAESSRRLLPVLEEFLAAGGSKADAARSLFISRRLLYARLGEIAALIGKPIEDVSVQVDLAVAVRAWRYLRSRRDVDF